MKDLLIAEFMVLVAQSLPSPASQLGGRGVPGVPQGGQMQVLHGVSEKEARVLR